MKTESHGTVMEDNPTTLEAIGLSMGHAIAAAAGVPAEDACHRCETGHAEGRTELCAECWAQVSADAIDMLPYLPDSDGDR